MKNTDVAMVPPDSTDLFSSFVDPVANVRPSEAPGVNVHQADGYSELFDPETQTPKSISAVVNGKSIAPTVSDPPDIEDSVLESASDGFKAVMKPLNKLKDPSYQDQKGLGYSGISISPRVSKPSSDGGNSA